MFKFSLPLRMLAVTFALIYAVMCPRFNPGLIDGMLFHPMTDVDTASLESIVGVKGREVTFGNGLTGWLYLLPSSKHIVLFSHGNGGNVCHRIGKTGELLVCGQSVFVWDYPGFGHSTGCASLKSVAKDGLAAYDYLAGLGYKPDQIVLYGESLGSGVNADIMEQRKVKAVICDSGFTSLQEVAQETIPIFRFYPDFLMPPRTMKVRDSLRDIPCMIIHGQKDTTIPYHHAVELHEAARNSILVTMPNGDHGYIPRDEALMVEERVKEFFSKL